jgi:hypothetical protein
MRATLTLDPTWFTTTERVLLRADGLSASAFRYDTGVAALRLANPRGHVVVLPWLGQIVWDAVFDGARLTMRGLFDAPRPAAEIIDTYGCFAFHSGLLRNGCPGPEDTHKLHGEMACAAMDTAELTVGEDGQGPFLTLGGAYRHARGFGGRYRATPSVTLRAGTLVDIAMLVENTGGKPMDLMYMCHVNFDFVPGGEIVQPAGFDAGSVTARTEIPAHVPADPAYRARIAALARDPSPTRVLDPAFGYDPEQVFYVNGLGRDAAGDTHLLLRRPEGDAFAMSYNPDQFPHTVRWLLRDADHAVAAFALPSTCQPEGYTAERRKGHVRTLPPGWQAHFTVRTGYLDREATEAAAARIAGLRPG